ncbi:MAG: hypothetical protein JNN18_22115 [Rubrivivax sp.]|jgi:polyhydroxyalkanoate synthesis regulator phasin|nr:hypothetical protein [Rubrivivax sp.]
MAGEVTQKDLQSLQGYVNKQIAELEKRLKAMIGECGTSSQNRDNAILGDVNALERKVAELGKAAQNR